MSTPKFINIHSHIFTVNHAPDYFLQTVIPNRTLALWVHNTLQKRGSRWLFRIIKIFFWGEKRSMLERYANFVEVGLSASQEEVFSRIQASHKKFGDHGIVVLPQVLDTLDLDDIKSSHKRCRTQVYEVLQLKRNAIYRSHIFPFLPVDPREAYTLDISNWISAHINPDKGFCGIKIYPAAGFFPFDIRLDSVWKWAEENQIPVMTHATRTGSYYLGTQSSILSQGGFIVPSLNPGSPTMGPILNLVNATLAETSILKKNKIWCNVFGNPICYEPVLQKYPNLKICFAHLGGINEVVRSANGKSLEGYPPNLVVNNWYTEILRLMTMYKNVYADISYTLSDDTALGIIAAHFTNPLNLDNFDQPLIDKLLYGTDFYMTKTEKRGKEVDLQKKFMESFPPIHQKSMVYDNPARFLKSRVCRCID